MKRIFSNYESEQQGTEKSYKKAQRGFYYIHNLDPNMYAPSSLSSKLSRKNSFTN